MPWAQPWSWQDVAASRAASKAWRPSKAAERRYAKQLRSVADQVGAILGSAKDPEQAQKALREYGDALDDWARQAALNMAGTVKRSNELSWRQAAQRWGVDMRALLDVDLRQAVADRVEANVQLIKSLPWHAAMRVGEMAQDAMLDGTRAETLIAQIQAQGPVTQSRARTIAQTEISKCHTALTQARAQGVGSEGYIWRTARDGGGRPSHRAMEGRFVPWHKPPTLDGMTGHAGEFPNCRCYPEPVVPDEATGKPVSGPLPTMEQETAAGEIQRRSHWERQDYSPVVPHMPSAPMHNVEQAGFDPRKLTKYSMDPGSPRGKDKARVWLAALGMDKSHAAEVQRQVMEQLPDLPAKPHGVDKYGERYNVMVPVTGPDGRTVDVVSAWIYDRNKETGAVSSKPRLLNCYVPKGKR